MSRKFNEEWQKITPDMIVTTGNVDASWRVIDIPNEYLLDIDLNIDGVVYKNVRTIHETTHTCSYDRNLKKFIYTPIDPSWSFYCDNIKGRDVKFTEDQIMSSEFRWRKAKNVNKFIDDIEVGDFVQFSGQRDAKSWRKIIGIDWHRMQIFGFKYSKPIDDVKYDMRHSSENGIVTLKNLVKAKDAK